MIVRKMLTDALRVMVNNPFIKKKIMGKKINVLTVFFIYILYIYLKAET